MPIQNSPANPLNRSQQAGRIGQHNLFNLFLTILFSLIPQNVLPLLLRPPILQHICPYPPILHILHTSQDHVAPKFLMPLSPKLENSKVNGKQPSNSVDERLPCTQITTYPKKKLLWWVLLAATDVENMGNMKL